MKAVEWQGTADMSFAATGTGTLLAEINASEKMNNSEVYPIEDVDFYALQDSSLSDLNKVQNCQAKLPIEKQLEDSSIFTTYTATLQARIYASKDDLEPLGLSETTFEFTLQAPEYEAEEFDPYDETWVDEFENEFFI